MTTDTKQLRELAKAAKSAENDTYFVLHAQWQFNRAQYEFVNALSPTTVLELLDTIEKQRALLERAKTAQQSMIDHMCFGRFEPEQPDDGWRPKSQALYDSVDEITQHMKETP